VSDALAWTVQALLIAYAAASLAHWLRTLYGTLRTALSVPDLAEAPPAGPLRWPRLSVVVPARNEAETIVPAARALLESDYPDLEIVLVDDRSTDATGRLIDALAGSDGRVRAEHVAELPPGWLGKVNALRRGLACSSGEYVLYTDADVHVAPDALRRAMAWCLQHDLDHLTAFPRLWPTSFLLDAVIDVFVRNFIVYLARPWAVGNPRSRAFVGIGAFNLVRRSAFERTEGFEWLRMETADDMGLGLLMKRAGARCGVVTAFGHVSLAWHRSLGQLARGAEKGYAAVSRFSLLRTLGLAAGVVAAETAPILTPLLLLVAQTRAIGLGGLAVPAVFAASVLVVQRWSRRAPLPGLAGPVAAPILAGMIVRAGVLGALRGGAKWRGTHYPAGVLRDGMRLDVFALSGKSPSKPEPGACSERPG